MVSLVLESALLLLYVSRFVIRYSPCLDWYCKHCLQGRTYRYDRRAELGNFDGPLLGKNPWMHNCFPTHPLDIPYFDSGDEEDSGLKSGGKVQEDGVASFALQSCVGGGNTNI